jgi:hypothetical protein
MRAALLLAVLLVLPVLGAGSLTRAETEEPLRPAPAFKAVDLWIDAGAERLAAWQVEIAYDREKVKVVGLEGGEPEAWREPPRYDPAGLDPAKAGGRLILAAFTVDDEKAPKGRSRVARLHLLIEDGGAPPALDLRLVAAAKPGGARVSAEVGTTPAGEK